MYVLKLIKETKLINKFSTLILDLIYCSEMTL